MMNYLVLKAMVFTSINPSYVGIFHKISLFYPKKLNIKK